MTNDPGFLPCCTCTDNCKDPTKCECILRMNGCAYDADKTLICDKSSGIYECNQLCSCHMSRCGKYTIIYYTIQYKEYKE